VREVLHAAPKLRTEEMDTARREVLRAQRSALLGLRQDGVISQEVIEKRGAELDTQRINGPDTNVIEEELSTPEG
jgi:hypothetical protein